MNSKDRIKQFIDYKQLDYYPFEMSAGLSNGTLKKATGISSTTLEKIHKAYPDLNFDWVITGRGEMIYNNNLAALQERVSRIEEFMHSLESSKGNATGTHG